MGPSHREEAAAMYRFGKKEKRGPRHTERLQTRKSTLRGGRDILRREESFKIAPKHPGMGRR
jgi:hypothetical protein